MSVTAGVSSAAGVEPGSTADVVARTERMPFIGFHLKARVIVGTATLFDGFDAIAIADRKSTRLNSSHT